MSFPVPHGGGAGPGSPSVTDPDYLDYLAQLKPLLKSHGIDPLQVKGDYVWSQYSAGASPVVCALGAHAHLIPVQQLIASVDTMKGACPQCQCRNLRDERVDLGGGSGPGVPVIGVGGVLIAIAGVVILFYGAIFAVAFALIFFCVCSIPLLIGLLMLFSASLSRRKGIHGITRICNNCGHAWKVA